MSARRLSDAQVRFLRACDRAGQVQVASLDHQERRTVRGLQTRGLVSRETSGAIRVVVLTDGGRDALAGTSRDPEPARRRIIPRGAETRATSARRVAEAERGAARSRAADAVAEWNESHPVGIQVTDRAREVMLGTTVAPALQLASGAPVVLLESEGPAPARVFYLDEVEPYARPEPNFAAAYSEGLRCASFHAPGEEQARAWNEAHQPGVVVDYHPIIGEPASTRHRTRTGARVLPSGEPVVWLEGVAGCVALDAVRPTARPAPGERCAMCHRDDSRARQIPCALCNPVGPAAPTKEERARYYSTCGECQSTRSEDYMVTDAVWRAAGLTCKQIRCLACLASRLGRPLQIEDFTRAPINDAIRAGLAAAP